MACTTAGQLNAGARGRSTVTRIKTATIAALLISFVGLPAPTIAQRRDRDRRDRYEDRWDRRDNRRDDRRDRRDDVREARREWREERREALGARRNYWDAARYYRRDDYRYRARRLNRNDWIYRGSDNRYYCNRDDGTTGLIVGGVTGGVLGNIIAPGGSKTLGAILGAGAGALIGRAIDDGDIVCR